MRRKTQKHNQENRSSIILRRSKQYFFQEVKSTTIKKEAGKKDLEWHDASFWESE